MFMKYGENKYTCSDRNVKLQLYNTLICPTVTYASKTWVLKENMIN